MKGKRGRVTYGSRAFHQDAAEAMGGDIVRALIETITNCDDAYGSKPGKIRIEVEHRRGPWTVITKDRACGMSTARMEEAIAHLGGSTSGFASGADVRGNLGRGAKDLAAFGSVDFESICAHEYAHMRLEPDGNYTLDEPRQATPLDRERLGIPRGNGTVVTIHATENIRCPQHSNLVGKLSRHYQLRDIMADSSREVTLFDQNKGTSDVLRRPLPTLPVVLTADLTIEGYPQATARLTVCRNPERYEDPASDPLRPAGLLIKGRRAIYENTLLRFEANPFAGWFSGRVECAHIDQLAAEYDGRLTAREPQDERNPIPIITRRRDGLQKTHPFYKALAAAVERHLGQLIAEEERKSRERVSTESARLRRALDGLGRDLSRLIDEDLRQLDEEGLLGSEAPGANPPALRLVPEDVVLYIGEDKTVSVMANPAACTDAVTVRCEPAGVVEVLDGECVSLAPHPRRPDVLCGQIRLRPLMEDQTLLTATCGTRSALALVEVRPERVIEEVEVEPVERFQFERDTYRIAWTKKRAIRMRATISDIATHGADVSVSSSDPGVIVRTGRAKFSLDEDLEEYQAQVTVEGHVLSSQSTLTARLGDLTATCRVVVTKEDVGPSLSIRMVDEEAGYYRAIVEHEGAQTILKVMGRHPVMRRYRGLAPDFPGDDLPATKLLVAEIVADQAARMILERKFPSSSGHEQIDAARFYVEHYRYLAKYLPRCHKALLSDSQLAQAGQMAAPVPAQSRQHDQPHTPSGPEISALRAASDTAPPA